MVCNNDKNEHDNMRNIMWKESCGNMQWWQQYVSVLNTIFKYLVFSLIYLFIIS